PGQQLYRIIPKTILHIKLGKKVPLHGGGHSVRSFIHIKDVSDATLRAARNAVPGEIYHFSTARNIAISELVRLICGLMGADFSDVVEISEDRPGKDQAYLLDSSKAMAHLGWKDRIGLEQGIEETIGWVCDNLEVLKTLPFDYIHKP
ncbi:MAG: GDP-mannose 4,6-dehydratase, partial [Nitrospirae bacterium]|nr:GDP-mannose 4,6-dehydratase [Nitrospirota bacterium]